MQNYRKMRKIFLIMDILVNLQTLNQNYFYL